MHINRSKEPLSFTTLQKPKLSQSSSRGNRTNLSTSKKITLANDVGITPLLFGVDLFLQSTFQGVRYCSLAGGAEIMFSGQGMSHHAENFQVNFQASTYNFEDAGQPISKDNAFNSQPFYGKLEYTTPSWMSLFGQPFEKFDAIDYITFKTYLIDSNMDTGTMNTLSCTTGSNCYVTMSRSYTPQLHYLVPRVMHHGSEVTFVVDPRSAQEQRRSGDLPFVEARVDSKTVNFEEFISEITTLNTWTKNNVRSNVYDVEPNPNSNVNMKWRVGNSFHVENSMIQCDISNTTCYKAKVVPVINKISATSGYTSGGQILQIDGYGFTSDDITVKVDGVDCKVLTHSKQSLTCQTGAQATPSTDAQFVGSNGLKYNFFNTTSALSYAKLDTETPYYQKIAMTTETPRNQKNGYCGSTLKGYLKAPVTGNYRFYVSCDDYCKLSLGTTDKDPSTLTEIYRSSDWTSYRGYFHPQNARSSQWIALTAGQYYYLEGYQYNNGGDEHFTVSVEIDTSVPQLGHHHANRQVQRLRINPTLIKEQSKLIILNPSNDKFTITIIQPGSTSPWFATDISTKSSANAMKSALQSYWSNNQGSTIQVELAMFDENGEEVQDMALSKKNVYTISVNKAVNSDTIITRPSFSNQATTKTSTFSFLLPKEVQKSSKPITGSFTISCQLPDGSTNTTAEIPVSISYWNVPGYINKACPNLRDRYDLWEGPAYDYIVNGRDFLIRFVDIKAEVPQLTIQSYDQNPIIGNEVTFSQEVVTSFGQTLMYEPIPFEWLFTADTKPQVLVSVNNLPAVCAALDCGYNYVAATSLITSFDLNGLTLTINGNDLPLQSNIVSITYSNVKCTITSASSTQIICTLPSKVAGSWVPQIIDNNGLIPVDQAVQAETLALTVSSITPGTSINPNGGSTLTITGQYLPTSLTDGNTISITFSDSTVCQVTSASSTQITCLTSKFAAARQTLTVTIKVNSQTDTSQQIQVSSSPASIISITPANVSPVIKSVITLQINPEYSNDLTNDQFTVKIIDTDRTRANDKQINVVGVDNDAKTIKIKYGGAFSGTYNLFVYSNDNGAFDTSQVVLTAIGQISGISPNFGSVYGGTLVTITGYTFGEEATDNPVKIGESYCLVEETSANQIKCRTQPRSATSTSQKETLLVFLKTSEEAVCNEANSCEFTWLQDEDLPQLTSFSIGFNSDINEHQVTLNGNGFPAQTSGVIFKIDGITQTVASSQSDKIVITISQMLTSSSKNIEFYLEQGTPAGTDQLLTTGITLTPTIISVTPSTGSQAGTLISATVKGVGTSTTVVTLTSSSGTDLCQSASVTSYSIIQCKTKAATVASTTVKAKIGSTSYTCTTGNCGFATSASMPTVASAVIESDKLRMTITGTNFFVSNFDGKVTYAGVDATSVTIDSATQLTATWSNGVPISNTAVSPIVAFQSQSSAEKHWATSTATVQNTLSVTALSSDVSCSFNGGCTLQIDNAPGLASQLAVDGNEIRVCESKCTFNAADSTSSTVKCSVPSLSTSYSITNYQIQSTSDYVMGTVFGTNSTGLYALTNDINQDYYLDTSASCNFGTYFRQGFIGQLSEVKFFMPIFLKSNFVDKLVFQGSQDGNTYTDIFTVSTEIHEGWNYYDFRDNNLKYRYYRFQGNGVGSCKVGEIKFRGVETIDSTASSYQCQATLNLAGQTPIALTGTITYTSASTPVVNSISPRFGKVQGGDTVTFTGTGFTSTTSDIQVKIDGINCVVQTASTTEIKCISGSRPGLYPNPSTQITISGKGSVAMQGRLFRYVNLWSLTDTWGGEFQPVEGESVYIPKGLHLLVDVDSTPILNAVIVEGSLIFPPNNDANHLRTFDAHYVMVQGGYLEVGTEEFPYTSKLIITMHSSRLSPEIPTYGNKVIAVRNGILDFHGVKRNVVWTELASTANVGASSITLIEAVDWKIGEDIVIAPTGYDNREAEVRTIIGIQGTNTNPVLVLDKPLLYKHYSDVQYFGGESFEMRAEVGLITRNVVYRGDPETSSANEYGAHIMLHSAGDESLIGRIEYCEFRDVGQAFQLGRYPIHFHMIGTVHNSYVIGNSIHHTYNRAVTIHGVHYLRIINNVAYHTMGHTFFIEDAAETKNLLDHNLAVQTMASFSLLITDQTPASFWITHPDNIFRNNHAAGSDRYGYWFDTKPNPMGPSFNPDICPENDKLGEFQDNVAHSNGKYGLRIFHNLIPRQKPCSPIVYDPTNIANPYAANPLVTAEFKNFRSWKNVRNGAIAEKVGDVRFINFKVADNLVGGIEFSLTGETMDGTAQIIDALVIGHSANAEQITMDSTFHGIITPRTENFQVNGAKFYNYDQPGHAAFGSCSHCFHPASTDSGARTVTFSRIYFDSTVKTKIRYQLPWRDIFFDTDGTLTGLGPNTWATPFWPHNVQPECQVDLEVYDGILCDSTVQVRRLAFWRYSPSIFAGMELKVTKWDDNLVGSDKAAYIQSLDNVTDVSILPFKTDLDPKNGWAVPYVTGHKYKVHWRYGLDFVDLQIDQSSRWKASDKNVYMVFNFTDVREKVEFKIQDEVIDNMTLVNKTNAQWQTGDNIVYNATEVREIHTVFNGKNSSRSSLRMKGYRCVGSCLTDIEDEPVETTVRRWSDPNSWTNKQVPTNMSDVVVESGWNMLYDIADTNPPTIYNMIQVNGRLTFEDEVKDLTLRAKYLFVRAGELVIGNQTNPFVRKANIILHGEKANQQMVYDNAIEAGNKILANTASISIYGNPRNRVTRLTKTANPGETKIFVETGLDWRVGDELALTSSTLRYNDTDYVKVVTYNSATGEVQLDRPVSAYHYGAAASTASAYNGIDIRNEVYMLTRNVKIQGQDVEAWGCQIVTSDFVEGNGVIRRGRTYMNNVQIYNCSQYDTYKAAIRFEGNTLGWSEIAYSSIYHGYGYGVQIMNSANVKMTENTIFSFVKRGINVGSSTNITLDGNHVSDVAERSFLKLDMFFEPTGGIIVCAELGDICTDIKVVNNIVSSCLFTGFAMFTHNCGDYNTVVFRNNVAHSIRDTGGIIFADGAKPEQKQCAEASKFAAYKCGLDGLVGFHSGGYRKLVFTDMTFIDNGYGATGMVGMEGDDLSVEMNNIVNYGESEARDCFYENECKQRNHPGCVDRSGLMIAYFAQAGKDPLPKSATAIPIHKIKKDASYGGQTTYKNMKFINFKQNSTWCGTSQRMIRLNEFAADYIPRAKFLNTRFENSDLDSFAYLFSPPSAWANLDDCGDFPCTAPNNALLQFEKSTFGGSITPSESNADFQILPNNVATVKGYKNCKYVQSWNGYYCTNDNLGVLLFESIDDDKWKRMITPIYIKNNATGSVNTLNTFMDHIWDGFYTGQLRLARWPSIIQTGSTMTYDINYKGTPPENQRFSLRADYSAVVLRINYPKPSAYAVTDWNGNVVTANGWDDSIKTLATIKRSRCGENRYIGVDNVLEFFITAGCQLMIKPLDSIRTAVRLDWTLSAFYADGGTTKFVDRLAASLGIHASTIKVVAVYQGSVIVDFQIIPTGQGSDTVSNVQSKLQKTLQAGATMLGAPIIGLEINGEDKIKDGKPVNNTNTGGGSNNNTNNNNNTGGGQIIYNNTAPVVVVAESGSSSDDQAKLIIIFAVIVVVIIIGAIASYFIYRRYKSKQMLENVNQTMKQIPSDSIRAQDASSNQVLDNDNEVYEPQYHPKAELGNIFGSKTAKMNNADDNLNEVTLTYDDNGIPHVDTDNSQIDDKHQYESTPLHSNQDINSRSDFALQMKRNSIKVDNNNQGPQEYQDL